jgi:hypothetical protein
LAVCLLGKKLKVVNIDNAIENSDSDPNPLHEPAIDFKHGVTADFARAAVPPSINYQGVRAIQATFCSTKKAT